MPTVQPIIIIRRGHQDFYPSICEASKVTGISRKRLYRALESEDGVIENTKPQLCIDFPSWDVTAEDIHNYYLDKEEKNESNRNTDRIN